MYSKNKNIQESSYHDLTPPPGYDGSRLFTRRERSDGRDENFVVHTRPIYKGRDKSGEPDSPAPAEEQPRKMRFGPSRSKETEAPIEVIYEDIPQPAEERPPFPGVEAFLEEPDEFWEVDSPDIEVEQQSTPLEPEEVREEKPPTEPKSKPAGLTLPEPLAGLLHGLEREDILLIGLIILLSGDKNMGTGDILLLLALLLITK